MANATGQGGNSGLYIEDTHVFNCVNGVPWTPAAIPVGKTLVGISASVITSDVANSITDSDGTIVTNLPVGANVVWNTDVYGQLTAPQQIVSGVTGRILITFSVR